MKKGSLGFGPLLNWVWESFATAETGAQKTPIALGTLTDITGFNRITTQIAKKLFDEYTPW